MKLVRKYLSPALVATVGLCVGSSSTHASTTAVDDVRSAVSDTDTNTVSERQVITVKSKEAEHAAQTMEIISIVPPAPAPPSVPSVIESYPPASGIPSITIPPRPVDFELFARQFDAAREKAAVMRDQRYELRDQREALSDQTMQLNRQLLAYNDQLTQLTQTRTRKPADRESWEAYRKAYNLLLATRFKEAIPAFDNVEKKYPKSDWADDAAYWSVYSHEKTGEPLDLVYLMYEQFTTRYPDSRWVETARGNMVGIANRLALSGKTEYTEKIRRIGGDNNLSVSLSALTALQMSGEDAIPEIEALYKKTSNPAAKERILSTVLANKSDKATDFLIRIAETDSSDAFRRRAVDFLGSRNSFTNARNLYVNDVMASVNRQASTQSSEDKKTVYTALERIARNDPSDDVRGQALYWISKSGTETEWVKFLETTAKTDPSMEIRQKALLFLSQLPDGKGVPGLIGVAKSDESISLRKIAITYLGISNDPRAKEALREIVREGK